MIGALKKYTFALVQRNPIDYPLMAEAELTGGEFMANGGDEHPFMRLLNGGKERDDVRGSFTCCAEPSGVEMVAIAADIYNFLREIMEKHGVRLRITTTVTDIRVDIETSSRKFSDSYPCPRVIADDFPEPGEYANS